MTAVLPAGQSHFASQGPGNAGMLAALMGAVPNGSTQPGMSAVSANANHMIEPSPLSKQREDVLRELLMAIASNQTMEQPDYRPAADLPDLKSSDAQGHQFLEEFGTVALSSARKGPRVVEVDLLVERHGQGTHNVNYNDDVDTHLTQLGVRQAESTAKQLLSSIASGTVKKPDFVFISPLERCSETIDPTLRSINDITTVNGVEQVVTKSGYWALAREILNPGASGARGPSHVRMDRDFTDQPFLNATGFSGSTDAWKNDLYEIARQGEARGQDLKNGIGRLMGGYCSMTDKDSAGVFLSSHAEILHELHNAAMEEEGWNADNGFINASTKGYKMKVLINGTYGSDDFDTQILSIKRNTDADFAPKAADLRNDKIVTTPWKFDSSKISTSSYKSGGAPSPKISTPTLCDISSVIKSFRDKHAAGEITEAGSVSADYSRGRSDAELKSALEPWIKSELTSLPQDGYSRANPKVFARRIASSADVISAM